MIHCCLCIVIDHKPTCIHVPRREAGTMTDSGVFDSKLITFNSRRGVVLDPVLIGYLYVHTLLSLLNHSIVRGEGGGHKNTIKQQANYVYWACNFNTSQAGDSFSVPNNFGQDCRLRVSKNSKPQWYSCSQTRVS